MRLRVEAGRASLRTSARMITTVTGLMAAGLVLLNRGYLAPYDSAAGQLVLLLAGAIFTAGFTLLRRMARHQQPPASWPPPRAPPHQARGPAPDGRPAPPRARCPERGNEHAAVAGPAARHRLRRWGHG